MCTKCAKFCVFLCIVLAVSSSPTRDTSSLAVYINMAAVRQAKNSSVAFQDTAGKCGEKDAWMFYLEVADEMINKAKMDFLTSDNCSTSPQEILDCSDLLRMGHRSSGMYTISPRKGLTEKEALDVYCDMETDGGGWTVIQRRGDYQNAVDYFYKDWKSYKEGFGHLEKEFWLGNNNIFALTHQKIYSARFDLMDVENNTRYAQYDEFWIDDENNKYTLHIAHYSGNAGDSMMIHNNKNFSTKDQYNDKYNAISCAIRYTGAWWFSENCFQVHLNGENLKGRQGDSRGKIWGAWKGSGESLARAEIKIRPKNYRS